MIGSIEIDLPRNNMTRDEALEYARKNIETFPLPQNKEYLIDSSILDEENCDFNEDE